MRFINYDATSVMAYHTDPTAAGTATFEHTGRVTLSAIRNALQLDGKTPNPNGLTVTCPVCGATAFVPLTGNGEAQYLFAQVAAALGKYPSLAAAIAATQAAVAAAGGIPRSPSWLTSRP